MDRGARDCLDGFIVQVISVLCPVAAFLPLTARAILPVVVADLRYPSLYTHPLKAAFYRKKNKR